MKPGGVILLARVYPWHHAGRSSACPPSHLPACLPHFSLAAAPLAAGHPVCGPHAELATAGRRAAAGALHLLPPHQPHRCCMTRTPPAHPSCSALLLSPPAQPCIPWLRCANKVLCFCWSFCWPLCGSFSGAPPQFWSLFRSASPGTAAGFCLSSLNAPFSQQRFARCHPATRQCRANKEWGCMPAVFYRDSVLFWGRNQSAKGAGSDSGSKSSAGYVEGRQC